MLVMNHSNFNKFLLSIHTVPSGPPEDVKAEPNTPTSIIIKWKKVDECKRNGKITKYIVEVYNSSLYELKWFNVSGSTYQVIVSDLQYANYSAKVQAYTAVGEGPFSEYKNTTPHQPGTNIENNIFVCRKID